MKNKKSNIIVECSPDIFHKFMMYKKIYIGWERLPVYEDINVQRCFKCQEYTHKAKDCKNTTNCVKCGQNHASENCQSLIRKCINCEKANRYKLNYNIEHAADSTECPTLQFRIQAARSRTDYG